MTVPTSTMHQGAFSLYILLDCSASIFRVANSTFETQQYDTISFPVKFPDTCEIYSKFRYFA